MTEDIRPWYREPMVWLMLAIPFATVIGGLVTLSLAMRDGAADVSPHQVTRTAQAQDSDIGPDVLSAKRQLHGTLAIFPASGLLIVTLSGVTAEEGPLRLDLVHPLYASEDRHVIFDWRDGRWQTAESWPAGRWHLSLADRQGSWRIVGQAFPGPVQNGMQVELQSAMASP